MFLFCLVFSMSLCASVYMCFGVTCWERAWLSLVVSTMSLSLSHWYPGSGVVLDCINSQSLHPYLLCLCLMRLPHGAIGWLVSHHLSFMVIFTCSVFYVGSFFYRGI